MRDRRGKGNYKARGREGKKKRQVKKIEESVRGRRKWKEKRGR